MDLSYFASEQVATRLGRLAYQVHLAARRPHADAVHDLRVAIRRFGQGLDVFGTLLPRQGRKKIRKKLRRMMRLAAEVRERDIALEFLARRGVPKTDPLSRHLARERDRAQKNLVQAIKRWHRSDFSAKWRAALQLSRS